MNQEIFSDELFRELKLYLTITWEDEKTNDKIKGIVKRGIAYIKDVAGVELINFNEDELAQSLLFDYCRYENSHALEMFEENFLGKLLRLNSKYQAKALIERSKNESNK